MSSEKSEFIELARLCASGDRKAQERLYRLFYGRMLPVCLRYAKDSELAKDLLQDAFIKVFSKIKSYDGVGSLEGWIRRIVVNNAIDEFRKKKNDFFLMESIENFSETEEEEDDDKEVKLKASQVIEALQELTPAYRAVFNMFVFEEMTHAEIAEKVGISVGTSKSNLSKAKRNLKNILLRDQRF
ncbi:MAG: RNA polymerase sigma factor [Flavobacteriales bacterium]|jgi:RNA polymerase sigma factor (sigma-70 family)|tara:strand:+ start:1819 stop:2373 length:555 start_codon:yes stop_codon:yes gene_type:complete